MMKQCLCIAPLLEMDKIGKNEVFAPDENYLLSLPFALERELPVLFAPTTPDPLPINPTVSLRGRARKVRSRLRESIEQS